MNTRTDRLAERPPGLLDRIRASINNPSLMGEGEASPRYAKIQWSMILWRLLTLIQISVLIGAALLLVAHEATLVYVMVFCTYACLLNRPDLVMRETIAALEVRSNDLKTRLRKILSSFDEPAGDPSPMSSNR